MYGKPGNVRIVTGDGGVRGGVYPSPTADPMVERVDTEATRRGVPQKFLSKVQSEWKKETPAPESWSLLELCMHNQMTLLRTQINVTEYWR